MKLTETTNLLYFEVLLFVMGRDFAYIWQLDLQLAKANV